MYVMKFLSVVFIAILPILPSMAQDQSCLSSELEIVRENNENASICEKFYKTSDSRAFVASFNRSDLPQGFPQDGLEVERPASIDLVSEMNLNGWLHENKVYYYPKLTVVWKPPFSALSRQECTGYLLTWTKESNKTFTSSRLILLKDSAQRREKLTYKFIIDRTSQKDSYTFRVYSMPPPTAVMRNDPRSYREIYAGTPNAYCLGSGPGEWASVVSYHPRQNGTLDVKFSLPDKNISELANITKFSIELNNSLDKTKPLLVEKFDTETHPTATQGFVQFHGLASGDYEVKVWVNDTARGVDGQCICWVREKNGKKHCKNNCDTSTTGLFYLNVTEPTTTTPTEPTSTSTIVSSSTPTEPTSTSTIVSSSTPTEPTSTSTIVSSSTPTEPTSTSTIVPSSTASFFSKYESAIIGVVVGIVLVLAVIIVAVCLYRKQDRVKQLMWSCIGKKPDRRGSFDLIGLPPACPDPSTAKTVSPLRRLNVYIMVAGDHSAQLKAAESLATFLRVHCHCNVIYPNASEVRNTGPFMWFQQNIHKADHILFIDSEGAKLLVQGEINKMAYRSQKLPLEGTLFQTGLKHIMTNHEARESIVLVSFTGQFCQRDLQAPTTYILLQDMRDLLCKLHGLNYKTANAYDSYLPLRVDRIPELDDGMRLIKAIKEVKTYQKNNPDWCQENYGAPTPALQQVTSIDSGVESQPDRTRSVSMQDLIILSSDSPLSVLDRPTFPSPVSPGNLPSFPKAMPIGTGLVPISTGLVTSERPSDDFSVVTIGTNILNRSVASGQSDCTIQTDLCRESTTGEILPPESASNIHCDSFSTALRYLNNYNEQQSYGQRVGNGVQDPRHANTRSEEDIHNVTVPEDTFSDTETVIPPRSPLSDIQEDSFSAALQAINNNSEGMFTDDISYHNQGHGGDNDIVV